MKSWYCWIYRGPQEGGKYQFSTSCELPGGDDDPGLTEGDLMLLFKDLIELAHDDLSKSDILEAFTAALEKEVFSLGNCVAVIRKK